MAPKLIVEVVGDDSGLQRTFGRSSRAANKFDRDLGKATRGALAGSGVFRSLGRSLAFASGGFLAFATAGDFLRKSVDQAKEAQVVQKQLAAQFKASGQNLAVYQGQIDKTTQHLSLLAGFEDDQLKSAFTTIFRASGDVSKSLRDTALAADIARARHIDLSNAATLVAKVEAGNTGLLRRQGVQLAKNATVEQALAAARARFTGQAKAGTTAQERFGAVLQNSEEIIGRALLPTLNRYLNSGAKWLTQMNESGKLQKDVAAAGHILRDAISAIKAVIDPLIAAFRALGKITGGTENELKLLATAFVVLKTRAALVNFGLLAGGFMNIGAQAGTAAGKVRGLGTALSGLPTTVAITLAVTELLTERQQAKSQADVVKRGGFGLLSDDPVGKIFTRDGQRYQVQMVGGQKFAVPIPSKSPLRGRGVGTNLFATNPLGGNVFGQTLFQGAPAAASDLSRFQLNPAQRRAIDLAGDPSLQALRAQEAFDKASLDAIKKRFHEHKISADTFTKETVKFKDDLASVESQIASIIDAATKDTAAKTKKAADAAKKAARDLGVKLLPRTVTPPAAPAGPIPSRVSGSFQFLAASFEEPIRLQLEAAKAAALGKNLTPILKQMKAATLRALKSGRLSFEAQRDAWNEIASINDQLGNTAKNDQAKANTAFRHVAVSNLFKGLGLTGDQLRRAEAIAAAIGRGGTVPQRSLAFSGAGARDLVLNANLYVDGKKVAAAVKKRDRKAATQRVSARRGPWAGRT